MWAAAIVGALVTGIASAPHCAAMCGPLATLAGTRPRGAVRYHAARLAGYAIAGALAGATGGALGGALPERLANALSSFALAAALGVSAWRLWRSEARPPKPVALGRRRRPPSLAERLFAALPK
ncbi:MAG TPA: sulfite exporter TauE/SafE family protein, partial [Sandaracinaceae bacterium]